MNIFVTDHPLTTPSCLDEKRHPVLWLFSRSFALAGVVCPLLISAVWLAMLGWDSPDVPDPTWVDYLLDPICFLGAVPAIWMIDVTTRQGLDPGLTFYICVALDGLFWCFVIVAVYRLYRLLGQFRRETNAG